MYVLSFVWMLSDVIKGRDYELVLWDRVWFMKFLFLYLLVLYFWCDF